MILICSGIFTFCILFIFFVIYFVNSFCIIYETNTKMFIFFLKRFKYVDEFPCNSTLIALIIDYYYCPNHYWQILSILGLLFMMIIRISVTCDKAKCPVITAIHSFVNPRDKDSFHAFMFANFCILLLLYVARILHVC